MADIILDGRSSSQALDNVETPKHKAKISLIVTRFRQNLTIKLSEVTFIIKV